ncbi:MULTISPECIES: site-specific DNA-methyltransferase [unclassified Leucobacter]|uniref:DNA-methyltransferase n=1 Tax=unclassified Leucobacter TaxID=2621730 RepID=UPI00165D9EA6|nr:MULTISPECIES: site-specific DNA-methyltransferase [unclassified Leucobacter]MBC9935750.1 site-specific DNA-methyltransferase [Leucobacter sp. cx-87]
MNARWNPAGANLVFEGDNLPVLRSLPSGTFRAITLDPPFNTGRKRRAEEVRGTRVSPAPADAVAEAGSGGQDPAEGRLGFAGRRYEVVRQFTLAFDDRFEEYWGFLEPRLEEVWRLLADNGTLYLHLDYREVHYAKVLLDGLFGRECFLNEIIWAYDYGARTKSRWPAKHDNILVYVKNPDRYVFNAEAVDREPYMAPGLVTPEKAALGKLPTDTWWHTIVSPTGKERTGYPTQKPVGIVRRMLQASTNPGDWVLDCFAGSGTAGAAALELGRRFVMIDENPEAIEVMRTRFAGQDALFVPRPATAS